MSPSQEPLFTLRPATDADLPAIGAIAWPEGMDTIPGAQNVTVGVNGDGEAVCFLRLQLDGGIWHVNPVVAYPTWRGHGVARALMEHVLRGCGSLAFAVRGNSVPSYLKLGYEEVDWDEVGPEVAAECDNCPVFEHYQPLPMRK